MNKKILIFILILAMAFLVVGCGNGESEKMQGNYEIIVDNTVEIIYGNENRISPYLVDSSGTIVESRFDYVVSSDKVQVDTNGNVSWTDFPKEDVIVTLKERNTGTEKNIRLVFIVEELSKVTTITGSDGKTINAINQISFGQDITLNVISNLGPTVEIDKYCSIIATDKEGNSKNIFEPAFFGNQIVLKAIGVGNGELSIKIKDSDGKKLFDFSVPYTVAVKDSGLANKVLNNNNASALGQDDLQKIDVIEIDETIKDVSELALFENLKTIVLNTSGTILYNGFNLSYSYRVPAEKYEAYYGASEWSDLKDRIVPFETSIAERYAVFHNEKDETLYYELIDDDFSFKTLTFQGYTNIGWKDKSDKIVSTHNIKNSPDSCIHLYAVWTSNENKIVFDGNGATGGNMEDQIIATDSSANLTQNSYTRLGYNFLGWSTTPDGTVEYGDEANFLMGPKSITFLYAVWEESTEGFEFKLNEDGTYSVVGYSGNESEIRIPSKYEGILVTHIGERAFYNNTNLTRVIITDSITSIGVSAFEDCINLMSVTLGNSVASIGDRAFYDCIKLVEVINRSSLNIMDYSHFNSYIVYHSLNVHTGESKLVNKDGYLFYTSNGVNYLVNYIGEDKNLVLPINYNGNNYVINKRAFYNHYNITSVTIPDSVTCIGDYAFCDCTNLTSLTIPDSVTSIDAGAFYGCSGLTSVTIGNSVTRIGDSAFSYCINLTTATIGKSVMLMGYNAFNECFKLVEVINKSSLNIAKGSSFDGKVAYYSFEVHSEDSKVVNKDGYLFYTSKGVNYLVNYIGEDEDLILPAYYNGNNYVINKYAFYKNHNIMHVTIPDSVTSIGDSVFAYCTSLTNVKIPNSIKSISDGVFFSCSGLMSVTIPNSATSIGVAAFSNCTGLISVMIPDSVTSIGVAAFSNCTGLTSVIIPDSVTSIGGSAFYECDSLVSVVIGNGVTSIESETFYDCDNLTSLTIGKSVTSIGNVAFYECFKLVEVINKSSLNITKESSSKGGVARYAIDVHSGNSRVVNKDGYLFYVCGTVNYLVNYIGNDKDLILPVNYNGENYSIYTYAFYENCNITSVTISNSVIGIGNYAFRNCKNLTSVMIPSSVIGIGNEVFANCTSLTSINVDEDNTDYKSIDGNLYTKDGKFLMQYAIGKSDSRFVIPDSVTSIDSYAFRCCASLTSVSIGNGVIFIDSYAFSYCTALNSVTIGNSVISIDDNAFEGCNSLIRVIIPDSVMTIGDYVFYGCTNLTGVTIGSSVTSIGDCAFSGCASLTSVIFVNTEGWVVLGDVSILSSDLKNPSTAAMYLTSEYVCSWKRS